MLDMNDKKQRKVKDVAQCLLFWTFRSSMWLCAHDLLLSLIFPKDDVTLDDGFDVDVVEQKFVNDVVNNDFEDLFTKNPYSLK